MSDIHKNIKNARVRAGERMRSLFCVLMMLLMTVGVSGRAARKSDYVNVGMNAGYGLLGGWWDGMKVPGGFAGGLHIGYEYREGRFWFGGGGEFEYFSSLCSSDISVPDVYFKDTRELAGKMKYTMHSQRDEMQNWGMARVYIMAGYWSGNNNKDGFYVGGGLKIGSKFDLHNSTRVKYSTSAEYDRYIDDYEDMPNHYYTNNDVKDTVSFGTMLSLSIEGEIGWDLKVDRCNKLKVAFFVETGLNNIMDGVATREPWVNENNVTEVKPYSAYNSKEMEGRYVVPVMVGMKVSFLFNVSRINSRCHTCPCFRKR